MKTINAMKVVFRFCFTTLFFSCTNSDYLIVEQVLVNLNEVTNQLEDESSFVSLNKAIEVADAFLNGRTATTTSTRHTQDKKQIDGEPIKILDEQGTPLMYIINYKDGGFAIASATRNCYPVLAYSDKGSFTLNENMGGAALWLDKTKRAIMDSSSLNDSIKLKMRALWNSYEPFDISSVKVESRTVASTPAAIQACWERCYELENQYASDGWLFAPLQYVESVFADAGYISTYNDLCFSSEFNASPLDCSVIGWKLGTSYKQVGPLLETAWHQQTPFNDLCDGHSAGCAAVAMAQLMYYYQYPRSFAYNGYGFSWNTIPCNRDPNSDQAKLLKLVGTAIGTKYGIVGSWTTPSNFRDGVKYLLYSVTQKDYTPFDTSRYLLDHKKPIIMLGNRTNLSWLPGHGNVEYIGKSHYWVCDGVQERAPNELLYFTEWQPNGNGTFVTGWNTIDNPGILRGAVYDYYSMNWGQGSPSAWFASSDVPYDHSWVNFFIEK